MDKLTLIGESLTETTQAITSTIHWGLITMCSLRKSLSKYWTVPRSCRNWTARRICMTKPQQCDSIFMCDQATQNGMYWSRIVPTYIFLVKDAHTHTKLANVVPGQDIVATIPLPGIKCVLSMNLSFPAILCDCIVFFRWSLKSYILTSTLLDFLWPLNDIDMTLRYTLGGSSKSNIVFRLWQCCHITGVLQEKKVSLWTKNEGRTVLSSAQGQGRPVELSPRCSFLAVWQSLERS